MKLHTPILALLIALLPATNVRAADDEKQQFLQSLSVPLSSTEMARLDYLIKQKAEADRLVGAEATDKLHEASVELSNFQLSKQRRPRLPAEVAKAMKPGAVTLVYKNLKIGPKGWPASIHISVVPKPLPNDISTTKAPGVETPTIDETLISVGSYGYVLNMAPSPFRVDVFTASSDQPNAPYQLVNSMQYVDSGFVREVELKYLKPRFKQGPMLIIDAGIYRSTDVRLLTFPDGLRGRMVTEHIRYRYDITAPDKRGFVAIEEKNYANMYGGGRVSDDDSIIRHVWNGKSFVAQPAIFLTKPYMVIGGLSKSRARLEKLRAQLYSSSAEVLPTSKYPHLPSGRYVLVLARFKTRQQADEWLKGDKNYLFLNKSAAPKFKFEVRRAS